jgi:hypothetical protein
VTDLDQPGVDTTDGVRSAGLDEGGRMIGVLAVIWHAAIKASSA